MNLHRGSHFSVGTFLFISFHFFASAASKDNKLYGALLDWLNNLTQCQILSCKTKKKEPWLHLTVHHYDQL
jgi:hypothetical protein